MNFKKRNIKLFVLSGHARCGKETAFQIIKNFYKDKKVVDVSFAKPLKEYAKKIVSWDGNSESKPRDLLQNLGIELIKSKIDDKLLIRRLLEDIEVYSYFYDIIVITDARLKDEILSIKEKYNDALTIRINRNLENDLTTDQKKHITETDLDNYNDFDYIISNDNYELLKETLENICKEV